LDLLNPETDSIGDLRDKLKDVGLAAHVEILENLPSASKDGDGNGDLIDSTIGAVLDTLGDATGGLVPNANNDGGYITQIATQLFGDNRTVIVVEERQTLLDAGVKDEDIRQVILVQTEDGVKRLDEVENAGGLEQIIVWTTDPDKDVRIDEDSSNTAMDDHKINLTTEGIQNSDIGHLFTNGMFNDTDTAIYNQQTQQGGADGILNYNQQHGVLGDLLESGQDAIAVNTGISSIGTGGAGQTGDLINQTTTIRDGDLTVSAHSQGTLMTQVGMTQQESLGKLVQSNTDAEFLVQYSGSPVNHNIGEELVTDIYGGEQAVKDRTKGKGIDSVFRSHVTPEDAVGSVLGYQSAGINNSENLGSNMWESLLSSPRLFGVGDPSPHSYYPCVIGCGEENYTPDIKNIYNPNTQTNESSRVDYYRDTFTNKDGELTVYTRLLPQSSNTQPTNNTAIDLKNIQGGK